jgi:hypothetical protein
MKIDIRVLGNLQLEKALGGIVEKAQKTIVRGAMRKEAKRMRGRVVSNITRLGLIKSGRMLAGYANAKIASAGSKNFIRLGLVNPTRAELGIPEDAEGYYPYALEYGKHGIGATPFIRPAIDNHKAQSFNDIGNDIGKGIERAVK